MMKGIFKEIALGSYENMCEESADMFAELNDVEDFHLCCSLIECVHVGFKVDAWTVAPEPMWHKTSVF